MPNVMSDAEVANRLAGGSGRLRRTARWTASSTRIEWIAAFFVGIVAAQHLRRRCCCAISSAMSIPDSYDFGRMLLGILIFWGIAATSYRGTHITVDLVWANVGPRWQRLIDVFATLVLLFVVTVQTYTLFDKVTRHLQRPTFSPSTCGCRPGRSSPSPGLGDVSAVLLIAIRTWRLIFHPEVMARRPTQIKPVE